MTEQTRYDEWWPPLHTAARKNDVERARALLDAGAAVDDERPDTTRDARTPLHVAATCGSTAVAELLLARGAAVDRRTPRSGASPLWLAAAVRRADAHQRAPATERSTRSSAHTGRGQCADWASAGHASAACARSGREPAR